jgi:rubrerythrin
MKKWRCIICDYVHDGPEPPEVCPECGASKENFVEI